MTDSTEGHLAGIEILDALKRFGRQDVMRQVILEYVSLRASLKSSPQRHKETKEHEGNE